MSIFNLFLNLFEGIKKTLPGFINTTLKSNANPPKALEFRSRTCFRGTDWEGTRPSAGKYVKILNYIEIKLTCDWCSFQVEINVNSMREPI